MDFNPALHMPFEKAGYFSVPKRRRPKASFELVVIAVEHRCDRGHVLWKHAQVELCVALLHHATQQGSVVDTTLGFVNGAAVATDFGDMARHALAFGDQFFAQLVVSLFEDGRLRMGKCCKKETHKDHHGLVAGVHSSLPSKKPLKGEPLSGKQKPRVPIELLNHSHFLTSQRRPELTWRQPESSLPRSTHRLRSGQLGRAWARGPTCPNHQP